MFGQTCLLVGDTGKQSGLIKKISLGTPCSIYSTTLGKYFTPHGASFLPKESIVKE